MSIARYLGHDEAVSDGQRLIEAEVVEENHPTLAGRARVSWRDGKGMERSIWAAKLRGVVARNGDRVLVTFPDNGAEPVVTGVIDSLEPDPDPRRTRGPGLALREDECLRISGPDGVAWLEIEACREGPRLRFLVPPEGVDMPGTLKLSGDAVELKARKGEITLSASGDVRVLGEIVRLN